VTRFFSPSEKTLPAWQGMQYERYNGRANYFQKYANDRYAYIKWTSVQEFLVDTKVNLK
jgi:hypothetical protein